MKYFFFLQQEKILIRVNIFASKFFILLTESPKNNQIKKQRILVITLKNFFRHVNYIDSQTCGHTFLRLHAYCRSQSRAKILLIHTM